MYSISTTACALFLSIYFSVCTHKKYLFIFYLLIILTRTCENISLHRIPSQSICPQLHHDLPQWPRFPNIIQNHTPITGTGSQEVVLHRIESNVVQTIHAPLECPHRLAARLLPQLADFTAGCKHGILAMVGYRRNNCFAENGVNRRIVVSDFGVPGFDCFVVANGCKESALGVESGASDNTCI